MWIPDGPGCVADVTSLRVVLPGNTECPSPFQFSQGLLVSLLVFALARWQGHLYATRAQLAFRRANVETQQALLLEAKEYNQRLAVRAPSPLFSVYCVRLCYFMSGWLVFACVCLIVCVDRSLVCVCVCVRVHAYPSLCDPAGRSIQ